VVVALPSRIAFAALVAVLAVAGLLTTTAAAGPATARYAPSSPAIATAEQIARAYWGTDPCGGRVTVVWERRSSDVNALSTWSSPSHDPYGDPADNSDCRIAMNPAAALDWPKLCTVIVHEFGHLTGHQHDPRPGRLMSEIYTTPLAQCTTPTARRAVASPAPATALRAG
jgi:hypothetical protein